MRKNKHFLLPDRYLSFPNSEAQEYAQVPRQGHANSW